MLGKIDEYDLGEMFEILLMNLVCKDRDCIVKQYPYRTAIIKHVIVGNLPAYEELLELLSEYSGKERGNHVVYSVTFNDGLSFAIGYSNNVMKFGIGVEEISW